jgi:hypothetical protein
MVALRKLAYKIPGRSFVARVLRYFQRVLNKYRGPSVHSVQTRSVAEFISLIDMQEIQRIAASSGSEVAVELLQHFDARVAAQWPTIPSALTDLRIDLSRMTDEEIIDRANRALANDLHPSGLRPLITDEGTLDWAANPSDSSEWLLMIHRHAWWPLWGAAYRISGDEKYAQAFVGQLTDWIERNPLPLKKSEHLAAWRLMEAGLRIRVSWIPAFGCFFRSPAFTDNAKQMMLRAFYDHGQFLHQFYTNRNHLVRESNGLISVGLCFPEFFSSSEWVESGLSRLDGEVQAQVNADGSHIEMSVGYQWLTIDEFEVTRSLLGRYQRKLPNADLHETLRKMYEFLASVMRPDRSFPQLNDGFILWDADRLAEAGRVSEWTNIEYVGSGGVSGLQPEYCSRSFPNAGLHVMRSDWSADARYLIFDTGPYGGPHGHEDKLSFELFAYGALFIVDPGSYTYERNNPYRNYFVGSQGHNTVLVDQGSQVRRWNSSHMTPTVDDAGYGYWRSDKDFDFASGRYDEGYAPFALARPDDSKADYGVIHQRDFIFAKPDYWIIVDYIDALELHNYSFLFHLLPGTLVEKRTSVSALLRSGRNGAQMILQAVGVDELRCEVVEGAESPIQGWYSEDHHKKCPAPVLLFETQNSKSMLVAWICYPLPPGANSDRLLIDSKCESSLSRLDFQVEYDGKSDEISIRNDPAARLSGETGFTSRVSVVRDGNGKWSNPVDQPGD